MFTFAEDADGAGTVVRWLMTGENTGFGELFAKVMLVDKPVGGDVEKGLAATKVAAEEA